MNISCWVSNKIEHAVRSWHCSFIYDILFLLQYLTAIMDYFSISNNGTCLDK